MNIFAIEGNEQTGEIDWYKSGRTQDNMRTVKMVLESTQLLSSAMHLNGQTGPYKLNHAKHPSTLWAAESSENWRNLFAHAMGLIDEYSVRFNKEHKCYQILNQMAKQVDLSKFPRHDSTPLKLAMPDNFKSNNAVKSYRDYYSTKEKMRYPTGKAPDWFLKRRTIPFTEI
jgi:hypothetical protein